MSHFIPSSREGAWGKERSPKGIPFLVMCSKIIELKKYYDGIYTETKNLYLLPNS